MEKEAAWEYGKQAGHVVLDQLRRTVAQLHHLYASSNLQVFIDVRGGILVEDRKKYEVRLRELDMEVAVQMKELQRLDLENKSFLPAIPPEMIHGLENELHHERTKSMQMTQDMERLNSEMANKMREVHELEDELNRLKGIMSTRAEIARSGFEPAPPQLPPPLHPGDAVAQNAFLTRENAHFAIQIEQMRLILQEK
jgi:chromosome segregation ATPase